jgi:hypothetical protein
MARRRHWLPVSPHKLFANGAPQHGGSYGRPRAWVKRCGPPGPVVPQHVPKFAVDSDGLPDPLDRWSRRVIGVLARESGGRGFYPSEVPFLSFQQFAKRCEPVDASPIGLLIHSHWGLWHAYRGGLLFCERMTLPARQVSRSPCESCRTRPCLNTCPVGAFGPGSFNAAACLGHISSATGSDCRELGCRARRACPVSTQFSYLPEQARFHMSAFLAGRPIEA